MMIRYAKVNNALIDIITQNPQINYEEVDRIVPIYYPIAIVEMEMGERSMEDFETIEYVILKLVASGITSVDILSSLMGLDKNYIEEILKMLYSYGHIADGKITPLGIESIEHRAKITLKRSKQKFQIDAMNGNLLKVKETISETQMGEIDETNFNYAHLAWIEGVSVGDLLAQIQKDDYANFIRTSKNETVNLEEVYNAALDEIKFTLAYMVILNDNTKLIFVKRYNSRASNHKERIKWSLVSVPADKIKYAQGAQIPTQSREESDKIDIVYSLLANKGMNNDFAVKCQETIIKDLKFFKDNISVVYEREKGIIDLKSSDIVGYGKLLYIILLSLNKYGCFYLYGKGFYDKNIVIKTSDQSIIDVANKLVNKIDAYGEKKVKNTINDTFEDSERKDIIPFLNEILDTFS